MFRSNSSLGHKKKRKEIFLNLKAVTMIEPVTRLSKITQYDDKILISISNLVETTCLTRYPIPMKSRMTTDHNLLVTS